MPEAEELRRVLPVIEALAASGVRVSIDTRKVAVAKAAVSAGATIINDVSATLWPVAADLGAGWVAMHMPADPSVMQAYARYDDVVAEVRDYLVARAIRARAAGVPEVWIDPGIGFGKTGHHNLLLLRHVDALVGSGFPVVIGASRKSFLGRLAPQPDGTPASPLDRFEASIATTAWAVLQGVDIVRVHDVAAAVQAVRLADPTPAAESAEQGASTAPAGGPSRPVAPDPPAPAITGQTPRRSTDSSHPLREVLADEGQVGTRHHAPILRLDHQGPPGGQRAPGRLRPQPPQGSPAGGDPVASRGRSSPGWCRSFPLPTTCTPTTRWV